MKLLWEGVYWSDSIRTSVRPSLRPPVRPSRLPCPLCSTYNSGWIHFGIFFKFCNFDFVLLYLPQPSKGGILDSPCLSVCPSVR